MSLIFRISAGAHLTQHVFTLSYARTRIRTQQGAFHSYLTNGAWVRTSVSCLLTESLWHSVECSKCLGYRLSLAVTKGAWRLTEVWGCSAFSLVREYCTLYCIRLNCSWLWCAIYHRKKKKAKETWVPNIALLPVRDFYRIYIKKRAPVHTQIKE